MDKSPVLGNAARFPFDNSPKRKPALEGDPMDNSRRKPGRPKAGQRTMPLVLEDDWTLTKVELALPAATAAALAEYAAWVQDRAKMTTDAAITATADFALRQIFRRDRLWQEHRKSPAPREAAAAAPTQPIQQPSTPSLPPPATMARPIPTPATAGIR